MKLGLGTVQWGMPYGVSNTQGVPDEAQIKQILAEASEAGITVLDTAAQYGASEERLGACLPPNHRFRIVTKTPALEVKEGSAEYAWEALSAFEKSLDRLHQTAVYGLLIHHAKDLIADREGHLWRALESLKRQRRVQKVGVSIYSADEIERVLEHFRPDLIQVPVNVLDQRLLRSGQLTRLKTLGIEVHSRSVFLQGLLLMALDQVPPYFAPWREPIEAFHRELSACGLTPLQGALSFALGRPEIDAVLVGVPSLREFREIRQAVESLPDQTPDWEALAAADEDLLNPARWRVSRG